MDTSRMPNLYENTGYNIERTTRKSIIIHTQGGAGTEQETHSFEGPLTIDTLSDVYIDSFISNNGTDTKVGSEVFILGVDEFNIRSVGTGSSGKYNNKIIIPNTTGATAVVGKTITHRATKFNYVGTINPCTLTELTVSLTRDNLDALDSGNYWITFVIVSKDKNKT